MSDVLANFKVYLGEHGRSARTVDAYVLDAGRYVAWCERNYGQEWNLSMLNRSDLRDYQVQCRQVEKVAAATWNRYVASLAVFASWLEVNVKDAVGRAEAQKLAPKSLTWREYLKLRLVVNEAVRTARTEPARIQAIRDRAVIALLADAALREGEVVGLRVDDLVLGVRKGRVEIRDAKGNKDRVVPLDLDSCENLLAWLDVRPSGGETLFNGKFGDVLQERGIQKMVKKYGQLARLEVTPHGLRHTMAYRWMAKGANLVQVAELLGHSSIEVTRRYTLPHYEDLESIVDLA